MVFIVRSFDGEPENRLVLTVFSTRKAAEACCAEKPETRSFATYQVFSFWPGEQDAK